MIAGATYRAGLAIDANGAVYIAPLLSSTLVPASAVPTKGADFDGGKAMSTDGQLYVRFA